MNDKDHRRSSRREMECIDVFEAGQDVRIDAEGARLFELRSSGSETSALQLVWS